MTRQPAPATDDAAALAAAREAVWSVRERVQRLIVHYSHETGTDSLDRREVLGVIDDALAALPAHPPAPPRSVCPSCGGSWWPVGDDSYGCDHANLPAPPAPLPLDEERSCHCAGACLCSDCKACSPRPIKGVPEHDHVNADAAYECASGIDPCRFAREWVARLATPEPTDPRCPVCHHTGAEHGTLAGPGCATCGCEALWPTPEPTEDGG